MTQSRWDAHCGLKLCALVVVNVVVMSQGPFSLTLAAAIAALPILIISTPSRHTFLWACWTSIWAGLYVLLPILWVGWFPTIIAALGYWITRFSVCAAYAWWCVSSTRVTEFAGMLRTLRTPATVVVPLTVMVRFIPAVLTELRAVWDSLRARGLVSSPATMVFHPIRSAELILVPLLSSTLRMADDLAASAIIRGLGQPGKVTVLHIHRWGIGDLLVCFIVASLLIVKATGWGAFL